MIQGSLHWKLLGCSLRSSEDDTNIVVLNGENLEVGGRETGFVRSIFAPLRNLINSVLVRRRFPVVVQKSLVETAKAIGEWWIDHWFVKISKGKRRESCNECKSSSGGNHVEGILRNDLVGMSVNVVEAVAMEIVDEDEFQSWRYITILIGINDEAEPAVSADSNRQPEKDLN